GLEVVEEPDVSPRSSRLLEPGMTLCLEPKLVAPEWGASFEDTVLIEEDGPRVLSKSPRELVCV
ncbi:MAG: M24 family metallopeptidase, partial [Candidatus Nezhaarchaeota archaeon]|nr:M24 family metallopeptidase [Candidatus Nezhaarchaeota archaeon]